MFLFLVVYFWLFAMVEKVGSQPTRTF